MEDDGLMLPVTSGGIAKRTQGPAAPLYFPVNLQAKPTDAAPGGEGGEKPSGVGRESTAPLPRAA